MDNQEFSDADLGLTPPVKPENKNVIIPEDVAPAVKRRDWNNVSEEDMFAPEKPSLFKPESAFKDMSPVVTSGLSHGQPVVVTTDGQHKRLAYWNKNEMSFQTKKPLDKYLRPPSTPGEVGDLPDAVSTHNIQLQKEEHDNYVKALNEQKAKYAEFEADMAKAPGSQRYVGNYGIDIRDSIKELEEKVRSTRNDKIAPENVLGVQVGQGDHVAFIQNFARSAAHTLGTLPGFTAAAPVGAKLGMKIPGPPLVKAAGAAIGGAITGTLGGMVSGGIEQTVENLVIPVSEQERANTMTAPTAATAGQTLSLIAPFNLQKLSTFGKAVGIGAKTSGMRNAARIEIAKNAAGMIPIGMAGRGVEAVKNELGQKRDENGNIIDQPGFSFGNVAKEIFSPSGIGHDLLTGAAIRGANKVGRKFEFHRAGAWLASKVPDSQISPEQKAIFDEAVAAQAAADQAAKAAGQGNAKQQQPAQPQAQQAQGATENGRPAGSVEPMPEFPPETASDAEKQAWLGAAQAWHEKYGTTHSYDGTPMAGSGQAAQTTVPPQAQAQPETAKPEQTQRKLTPEEQQAEDLKDFDPNSINPEFPSAPKKPGIYGDESIPGYKPEFDQPGARGAAEGVPPIAPMPRLPKSFFEGIPDRYHRSGYASLLLDTIKDPETPEDVRNLIKQRIDADKVNFDLVNQGQNKWFSSKRDADTAIRSQPGKENVEYGNDGEAIDFSKHKFEKENRDLINEARKEWESKYAENFREAGDMKAVARLKIREKAIEEARKKHLESKALDREVAAERAKNEEEARKKANAAIQETKREAKNKETDETEPQSRNKDLEEKLTKEDNAWIKQPKPGAKGILGMGAGAIRDFIRRPFTDQQNMNLEKTKAFLERNQQAKDSKELDGDLYRLHELRVKYHSGETQGAKPANPVKPEPVEPVEPFSGLSLKQLLIQKQIKEDWLKSSQYTKKEKDEFRKDIENINRAIELKSKEKNQEHEEDVEPKETDAELVRRRDSMIEDAKEFRENEDDASFKEFMDKARELNDRIKNPKKKIKIETDADLNQKEDEIATENPIEAPEQPKDEDIRTDAIDLARKAIKEWEVQKAKLEKLNERKPSEKTEKQIRALQNKIESNQSAIDSMVAKERARMAKLDPLKDKADLLEQNKANAQAKQDITRLKELEASNAFKSEKITSIKNYSAVLGKSISDLYDVTKKSMDKGKKDALEAILKIVNLIHGFEKYEDLTDVEGPAKESILRASKAYADILAGEDPAIRIYGLQQTFKHLKTLYWKSGGGESKAVVEARKFFGAETPVEQKAPETPKKEQNQENDGPSQYDIERHQEEKKRRAEFQNMNHGDWEMMRVRSIERIKELTKLLKQLYGRKQQTSDVMSKISNAHAEVNKIVNDLIRTGVFDASLKLKNGERKAREESINDDLFDAVMDYEDVPPDKGHEIDLRNRIDSYSKVFAKREAQLGSTAQPERAPEVESKETKDQGVSLTKEQSELISQVLYTESLAKDNPDTMQLKKDYKNKDSAIRVLVDFLDKVYISEKSKQPQSENGVLSPEAVARGGKIVYDALSLSMDKPGEGVSDYFMDQILNNFKYLRYQTHVKGATEMNKLLKEALRLSNQEPAQEAVKPKNVKPKKGAEQPKGGEGGVEKVIKSILALEQFTNEAQNYEVVQKRESMGTDGKWYSNGNFPAGVKDARKIPRNAGWVMRHKVAQTTHGVVHATKGGAMEALKSYQEKASKDFEEELRKMDDEKLKSQFSFWLKEAEKHGKRNKMEKEFADLIAKLDTDFESSKQVDAPKAPETKAPEQPDVKAKEKEMAAKKKAEDDAIAAAAKDSKDTRVDPTDGITYVRDGDQEIPIAVTIDKKQASLKGVQKVVKAGVDLDGTDPYQEIMPSGSKYFTNGKLIYIEAESALDRTPLRKNQQRKIEDVEQANNMGDKVIKIDGKRWIDVTLPDEPQSLTFELLESRGQRGDSDGVIRISTAWSTARNGINAQAFYGPDLLRQLIRNMDKNTSLRLIYSDYGSEKIVMAVAVKDGKVVGLAMPLNPTKGAMGTLYNPKAVRARLGRAEEPETETMASEDAMRAAQQGREQQKSATGDLLGVEGENYNRRVKPGVLIGEDGLPIRPGAGRRGQGELSFAQIAGKEYTEGGFPQWFEVGHNEVEYTVGKKFRDIEPESVTIPGGRGYRPDTSLEPGDTFSPREDMFAFGVDGSFRKTQADKYTPDHEEWLSGESETQTADWIPAEFSWYGRVNHPVYDTKGNVVIRGAISVSLNPDAVVKSNKGSEAGVEIQTKDGRVKVRNKLPTEMVQRLKEEVSRQGQSDPNSTDSPTGLIHLDRPENYDIFVFNESESARMDRGISSEDASPTQLMPAGTYNPGKNHMKPNHSDQDLANRGFISKFADNNIPDNLRDRLTLDIVENLPQWSTKKEGNASYEGALMIDIGHGHKRKIGEFNYNIKDDHGTLDWIKINYAFRGRKLSEVVGAELLERMRRDQATSVSAMVVDPLVRPIKMLERLLGVKNKTEHSETFEQTDANDQFGFPDQDYPGEYLKAVNDVQFNIDPNTELTTSGHQNRTGKPELDKFYDTGSTPETEKSTLLRIEESIDKPMDIVNAVDMVLKDLPETPRGLLLQQLSRVAKSRGLQISFRSTGSRGSYAMGEKTGLGGYTGYGETIRIWMPDVQAEVNRRGYKMMDTIIYVMSHEIAHHHTLKLINENEKITGFGENSMGFKDRVKALMDYAVVHNLSDLSVIRPEGHLEYGLTKEAEFMAEVLTNPRFRDVLNKIPANPDRNVLIGKPKSLLDQIFLTIKLAFRKMGINIDKGTLFDRATDLYAEALATPNKPMDKAEMDTGREGAFGPGYDKTYRFAPRTSAPQTLEQSNAELDANKANIDKLNSNNPKDVQEGIDAIIPDSELMPPSGGGGGPAPSSAAGSAPRAGKTKGQKAFDFATLRALSGISIKAHQNARRYPHSAALRAIANFIHARPGSQSRAFQRDIPTSISTARQKFQNQFVDIMTPIRSLLDGFKDSPNGGPTAAEQRELVYRTIHDMVTGNIPMSKGKIGEVSSKLQGLMKDLHNYRTMAGEKLGEIDEYFPAKYDSDRIAQNEHGFVSDASKAYEFTISNADKGPFYDNPAKKKKAAEYQAEARAEKAKMLGISVSDMLAMSNHELSNAIKAKSKELADVLFRQHQRGMSQEEFSSIFGSDTVLNGSENASMKRVFKDDAQRMMQKWQHADPFRVVTSYIASATKRAEMVRKFGDDGKIWENYTSKMERDGVPRQVIREMRRLMRKAAGIGTPPRGDGDQVYVDSLALITSAAALGKSALNNLVEPVAIGGRANSLRRMAEAYVKTWGLSARNILKLSSTLEHKIGPTFWEAYGHHIGTIHKSIDDAWTMGHSVDPEADNTSSKLRWLTNRVYKANLMDATEVAKQTASISIAHNYLMDLAKLTKKTHWMNSVGMDPAQSTADNLSELGIQPGLQKKFADWMITLDGLDKQQLLAKITKGDQMSRLFEEAVIRFSRQSAVVSNRAHKPEFQDSSGGATLLTLMNFSYSFAAEINSRVYDHVRQSMSPAPKGKTYGATDRAMMLAAPVISGAMAVAAYYLLFELKQKMYPTDMSSAMLGQNPWAKALNALSYAGFLGPKFEYAMKFVQRDQLPGGPAVKMAANIGRAAASAAEIPFSDKSPGAAKKSLVKAALPVAKGALVAGASAANPILGAATVQATNMTQPQNELLASMEDKKNKGIGDFLEAKPPGAKPKKGGSGGMEAKPPGSKK